MTELMKFESQVAKKYPELQVHEQEAVLGVLKYLDKDAKRYLLLHHDVSRLAAVDRVSVGPRKSVVNIAGCGQPKWQEGGRLSVSMGGGHSEVVSSVIAVPCSCVQWHP